MKCQWTILPLIIVATTVLIVSERAQGGPALSDAAKKETVYRLYADYKKYFPAVQDIATLEAMKQLDSGGVVFVDTRKPEEMAISMIPGAVGQDEFSQHPERFAGKTVIVYCTISKRSGLFARDQAHLGIDIVNLQGGILAWILEGGPVCDAQGNPTRRVHVYGDKWDLAPSGWDSVKFNLWEQVF